jgi:hypothetical protein
MRCVNPRRVGLGLRLGYIRHHIVGGGSRPHYTTLRLLQPLAGTKPPPRIICGLETDAARGFTQVLESTPQDFATRSNRGYAHRKLGNYEAAIDDYAHAIQLSPDSVRLYNNRGYCCAKLGRYAAPTLTLPTGGLGACQGISTEPNLG